MASTRKPRAPKAQVETIETMPVIESAPVAEPVFEAAPVSPAPTVFKVKEQLTPDMYITVRNGFNGRLVYKSRKTNEMYIWEGFGAEQDMELQELKNAKNSNKAFFENNWFMIDDPEVIAYLGVERFYRNALTYEGFDDLFKMKPAEIEARIALLSKGQRDSVAYRARQLIAEKEIDSLKVIDALEKSLGVELIER